MLVHFEAPLHKTVMKIKCPACSQVLNIPETAAGKVVKCPCGKQLRAPGGAPGAAAAPKAPASPGAGKLVNPPAAKRPAAPAAALGGFDADMFDELTDQDLKPVKSVESPGRPKAQPRSSGAAALQEAVSGADRRGEALIHGGLAPRPGFLTFLGIANACWAMLYFGIAMLFLGLVAMIPAIGEDIPAEAGIGLTVIVAAAVVMGILCIATALACFIRGRVQWYILVFSYSYGFADRLFGVIGGVMDGEGSGIVKAVVGILVGAGFWAYMHGDDVRAFHGSENEPMGKIVTFNVLGLVFGCLISGAAVFMASGGGGEDDEFLEEEDIPEEAAVHMPLGELAAVLPTNIIRRDLDHDFAFNPAMVSRGLR
jgi:hypothetical protein